MKALFSTFLAGALLFGSVPVALASGDSTENINTTGIDKHRALWLSDQLTDQAADIAYGSGPIGGPGGGTIGGLEEPSSVNDIYQIRKAAENLYFRTTALTDALLGYNPWDRYSERAVYDAFSDTRSGWYRLQSVAPYWMIRNMQYTYSQLESAIYGYNPWP